MKNLTRIGSAALALALTGCATGGPQPPLYSMSVVWRAGSATEGRLFHGTCPHAKQPVRLDERTEALVSCDAKMLLRVTLSSTDSPAGPSCSTLFPYVYNLAGDSPVGLDRGPAWLDSAKAELGAASCSVSPSRIY